MLLLTRRANYSTRLIVNLPLYQRGLTLMNFSTNSHNTAEEGGKSQFEQIKQRQQRRSNNISHSKGAPKDEMSEGRSSKGGHIPTVNPQYTNLQLTDYAALRLRGLPFTCKPEDIITFFKDYDVYQDSVKIGRNQDFTKTGEGSILFKDE